ncbi:hypothetical protein SASPL_126799 [Salvia splendens]|uniref:Uncharacterized protein n=1 Tax=Salvia splendens TaxID=180675 RepID=A0A8X8XJN1_SALSN|nr:hypothetical protein SASPL_126799 [Salvia splendens]
MCASRSNGHKDSSNYSTSSTRKIGNVCDEPLFDIIGVVVDTGKIVTHSTSRLIEIRLSDSEISGDVAFLSQESIYRFTDTRVSNDFDGLVVKTLADVQEDVDGSYWICGRIEDVECHYGQWSYMACKQCVKKVVKVKNGFNGEECDNSDGIAIPRFRFIVNVVDADEYIPPEIEEKLLGQTLLFRIHVKTSNEYWIDKPYTVNKICNDPQIVDKYIPPTLDSRGSNSGLEISPTLEGLSPFARTDVVLHGSTSGANDTHTKLIAKDSLKRSLDVEILGQTIVVGGEQKKLMIKQENN